MQMNIIDDLEWLKIDENEYRINDQSDETIAYLVRNMDNDWFCRFTITRDGRYFEDVESVEWLKWKATNWIYDLCNAYANEFHKIRDHLPSLYNLYKAISVDADVKGDNK